MDEPFGALDAQTRSAMQDLLLEVLAAENKTVMLITHSVEEAVYLSNRIIVMTARPTRIREIIQVPFAYPRTDALHESREFGELRAHVRDLVMQEYAQQARQRSPADQHNQATQEETHDHQPQNIPARHRRHGRRRRNRRARHRAGQDQDPRRLSAHAGRRRPDVARRSSRRLRQERPGAGVQAVPDRPGDFPGHDRRQPRRAVDRRRHLQLPRARPGQDVPRQRRRVRHRPALGARGRASRPSPTSRASASPPPPAPRRTCSSARAEGQQPGGRRTSSC